MHKKPAGYEKTIDTIHWCTSKQEAFVTFNSTDTIEKVLMLMGRKVGDQPIKMYRSSMAQREYDLANTDGALSASAKCEAYLSQTPLAQCNGNVSDSDRDDRSLSGSSMLSVGGLSMVNLQRMVKMKRNADISADGNDNGERINRVLARGFACSSRKTDVLEFFKGIYIPKGIHNLKIINDGRNDTMEAYVDVISADAHDAALRRNGQMFNGRIITGNSLALFDEVKSSGLSCVLIAKLYLFSILVTSCIRYPELK